MNSGMNMGGTSLNDEEILSDTLSTQKFITSSYNSYANECSTPQVRDQFINILKDEHNIQADVFDNMQRKGWYQTSPADTSKISQTKQKFQNKGF
ncbi:MAG: spore coat protein [Bacillota bacterium]|nr:spore coat protein [Bacillota bacterium]